MIDWNRVGELRDEIGCDGFAEVVELFLDEVDGLTARLNERPDPARYEEDRHFLKGCAWNLGFTDFGALCQEGERRASAGRTQDIDIAAIVQSYLASRDSFLAEKGGRRAADVTAA